jgi:hypothetical protein
MIEQLIVKPDDRQLTASGEVGCIMLLPHGVSRIEGDRQTFLYRPDFFGDILAIEWNVGTNYVVLPADVVETLFRNGWARPMTASEAEDFNVKFATEEIKS